MASQDPSLVNELQAAALRKRLGQDTPQQHAQQQPAQDPEALKRAWAEMYVKDPVATTALLSRGTAQEQVREAMEPLQQLVAEVSKQNYRSSARQDPLFRAAEGEFDRIMALVPADQMKGKKPEELRNLFEAAHLTAVGILAKKAFANQVRSGERTAEGTRPPKMGGSGTPTGSTARKPVEPELAELARRAGLTEKELAESLEAE